MAEGMRGTVFSITSTGMLRTVYVFISGNLGEESYGQSYCRQQQAFLRTTFAGGDYGWARCSK